MSWQHSTQGIATWELCDTSTKSPGDTATFNLGPSCFKHWRYRGPVTWRQCRWPHSVACRRAVSHTKDPMESEEEAHHPQQSGDVTEIENNAMRSVLGVGPIYRGLFQSYKVVSSKLGHPRNKSCGQTGHSPRRWRTVCLQNPINQNCFVSYGDASGGSTRAEQAEAGYVVMIEAFVGRSGTFRDPCILEISSCQTCCSQCLCSRSHGLVRGDRSRWLDTCTLE